MKPAPFDVVALTEDLPAHGLVRGQVGTVVDEWAANVVEVEFCDGDGRTYALVSVDEGKLMVLQFEPAATP